MFGFYTKMWKTDGFSPPVSFAAPSQMGLFSEPCGLFFDPEFFDILKRHHRIPVMAFVYISCLPSRARDRVTSSAYSSWEPTGTP